MRIRALTVFVGLLVLLAATTSSAQKGQKAPPQLVILDASVSPDGMTLVANGLNFGSQLPYVTLDGMPLAVVSVGVKRRL